MNEQEYEKNMFQHQQQQLTNCYQLNRITRCKTIVIIMSM